MPLSGRKPEAPLESQTIELKQQPTNLAADAVEIARTAFKPLHLLHQTQRTKTGENVRAWVGAASSALPLVSVFNFFFNREMNLLNKILPFPALALLV